MNKGLKGNFEIENLYKYFMKYRTLVLNLKLNIKTCFKEEQTIVETLSSHELDVFCDQNCLFGHKPENLSDQ